MQSTRWNSFLKKEQHAFQSLLHTPSISSELPLLQEELRAASTLAKSPLLESGDVRISSQGTNAYSWYWIDHPTHTNPIASAICVKGNTIWTIEDVGHGSEYYAVRCRSRGSQNPLWEYKGVGPYVSILKNRCYCLVSKNTLVYSKLVSWDAYTGKDFRLHYEEKDYRYNLELNGPFLRRQSGPKQDIFRILPTTLRLLEGISLESRRFLFDISSDTYVSPTKTWNVESIHSAYGLIVVKEKGIRTLYKDTKQIWKGVGQVLLDPFGGPWVRFVQPGFSIEWWNASTNSLAPSPHPIDYSLSTRRSVPYCIVSRVKQPTNLLVIGYGAYGIPTPMHTSRWEPLLHRGWAIAIGLWRGGGDDTPEWEDKGRVKGREDVLLDAEEVIREIQERLSIHAENTIVYGRSAGGLWVGGLAAKYPKRNDLIGGCYMEVPYLDVLRTTTNRELPLTEIETDEFALPEQRVSNLKDLLEWSPMEQLLANELPIDRSFQLVRTAEHDSEVFAYESAKWVYRWNKGIPTRKAWLALGRDQGHFVSGEQNLYQQASDLAILLHLIKNRTYRYKMANRKNMTRRNRKNARKNTRKNRKSRRANRK